MSIENFESGVSSESRRRLLKAGWMVPVVLAVSAPASVFAVGSGPDDGGHGHGPGHGGGEDPHQDVRTID